MRVVADGRPARLMVLACALGLAAMLGVAGCSGNDGHRATSGPQAVFQDYQTGPYFTYNINVAEPADLMLYLTNRSTQAVHLVSITVAPASTAMQFTGTSLYDTRRLGNQPATGTGILPRECPHTYVPARVGSLTVPAHATSPWVAAVTIRFSKPGIYWVNRFRVAYTTPSGSGWQYLHYSVRLTVRDPTWRQPTWSAAARAAQC